MWFSIKGRNAVTTIFSFHILLDLAALMTAIKKEKIPKFNHISLVLWEISIPYNENLKENIKLLDLDYNKLLGPLDSL